MDPNANKAKAVQNSKKGEKQKTKVQLDQNSIKTQIQRTANITDDEQTGDYLQLTQTRRTEAG